MKFLFILSFFIATSVRAQNFSPSAAGNLNQPSPSAFGTTTPNTAGPTTLGPQPMPLGDGSQQILERSNTAPTPIPDDTSLITSPSNDPLKQSQEEIVSPSSGATVPGSIPPVAPALPPDTGSNVTVPFRPAPVQ